MKKIFTLFLVGAALLPVVANAQVTVEAAAPKEQVAFSNEVKTDEQKPAFSPSLILKCPDLSHKMSPTMPEKRPQTLLFQGGAAFSLCHIACHMSP